MSELHEASELIEQTAAYLRVTGLCNADCGFCYRDSRGAYGESTDVLKTELSKIKSFGFNRVTFLGGEVFLRPDTLELIEYANKQGLKVHIATNGSLLDDDKIEFLNEYVNWVGIPLDAPSSEQSLRVRTSFDQYAVTTNLLRKFKIQQPKFKVRVSTVVTKINIADLDELGELLFESDDLYQPDGWRLLKFLALEEGAKNEGRYQVSDEAFQAATQPIISRFSDHKVSSSNSTYIVIGADSRLLVSKGAEYIDIGSFLEMDKEAFVRLVGSEVLRMTSDNSSWRKNKNI